MQETRRSGFPIYMCPSCHGAWLGAGALESLSQVQSAQPRAMRDDYREHDSDDGHRRKYDSDDDHGRKYDSDRGHGGQYGRRRKEGVLGRLMDMLGD
jgi:Zn-finger nucleic acid-binding protein